MRQTIFLFLIALNVVTYAQWTVQNSGTTEWLRGVDFINADTGIAVGYNGTVLRTTDGGTTWNIIDAGVTSDLYSVNFLNNLTCFITGLPGILKSSDGGLTWIPVESGWTYFDTYFVNNSIGYACGKMGSIAKTTDGGATWKDSTTVNQDMIALFFNNPDTGFVVTVGWTDAIRKTTDGGSTWTGVHSNTIAEYASVVFTSDDTGYVCSTGAIDRNILKTTDAGNTWDVVFTTPSGGLYDLEFPSKETGYAAGGFQSSSTIFKSTDAGITWESQYTNTTSPLFDCSFVTENIGYAVGMNGTIIKTTNGGVGIADYPVSQGFSIYPNPCTDHFQIDFRKEFTDPAMLNIYNIAGKNVQQTQITHNESVDVSNIQAGTYLIEVQTERESAYQMLIIR